MRVILVAGLLAARVSGVEPVGHPSIRTGKPRLGPCGCRSEAAVPSRGRSSFFVCAPPAGCPFDPLFCYGVLQVTACAHWSTLRPDGVSL